MGSKSLAGASVAMANANMRSAVDAALTIAARTHGMLIPQGGPIETAREAQLMVAEKVDAAVEGALAAQAAWGQFMIKAAFGGVRTPHEFSIGMADIAEAAARPARRKVRANRRRLIGA